MLVPFSTWNAFPRASMPAKAAVSPRFTATPIHMASSQFSAHQYVPRTVLAPLLDDGDELGLEDGEPMSLSPTWKGTSVTKRRRARPRMTVNLNPGTSTHAAMPFWGG